MRRTWKHFLSWLLVFAMVLSLGTVSFALDDETEAAAPVEETDEKPISTDAGVSVEKVDNDIISQRLPFAHKPVEEEEPTHADDEIVRVSIVLAGASALDAGYAPASAGAYRAGLRAEQAAMANRISAQVLDGAPLDVVWNLTLAGNIISANVEYGQIEAIRNVIGVVDVVEELRYYPQEDEIQQISATEMTGAKQAWDLGYTGAGSKIAIVDTGLAIDHQSFNADAFEASIDELNETREEPVALMTEADVAAVWDQLNAAQWLDLDGVYRNAKVPYGVNYVDQDYEITHMADTQGEHGSHVAGIAAANKYIPGEDGVVSALDTVMTQGEAPDAQLLIMKVFGKGGGAYDSDYMAAIEDALTLGCDAVNLSLGSSVAGYVENATYAELLNKLTGFGLVWCNSAGNNYSWTHFSLGDHRLFLDDVNYQTGGSPATYHNSLSVASVDNKGSVGYPIFASDETMIVYTETSGYGNEALRTIPGEYSYILIDGPGVDDNDGTNDQFAALGTEILEGKIGICMRGSSSFFVKANASVAQGAVATIIFNNQAGSISMNLTGYTGSAPCVSITANEGALLKTLGEEKEANGVTYYEGTLTISADPVATNVGIPTEQTQVMSAFSSWGGNGGLTMKPEITAPGGNIWSVFGSNVTTSGSVTGGSDQYEIMSGTSMASPQVAGLVAVLKQYIRETNLMDQFPNLTERAVAQSLLMSTAMPLVDANSGYYWSIMKQGAGLADVNAAINSRTLIQVVDLPESAPASAWDSIADGKVKVELGEVYNGFHTAFTVTNFSDEPVALALNGELFSQYIMNGTFRSEYAWPFNAGFSWSVNGVPYVPGPAQLDFNDDGVANGLDAQLLLDSCVDDTIELNNGQYADLDSDGNVDTHDAELAFELLNGANLDLAPGETKLVEVSAAYNLSAYDAINGNYVEGFLYVTEGETSDGALGVEHSIPVFGYNGSFSNATMFDRGSRLEYLYEFGDGADWPPYMAYGRLGDNAYDVETFLVKYKGDTNAYYFGGNPLIDDEEYFPERNALNSHDNLAGVRFTQIRNSGASRFYVTDKYDRMVRGTELMGGPGYAAYYSSSAGAWQNDQTTFGFNYMPTTVKEGTALTVHVQLAPEYYVNEDGSVRWEDLGVGTELSIPFVIDNTAPDIVEVVREAPAEEPTAAVLPGDSLNEDEEPGEEGGEEEEEITPDPLLITVHDNQFIAAVALFTDQGDELDSQGSVTDTIRGKEVTYTFDLAQIFKDAEEYYPYILVQVYDYACNLSTYKLNLVDDLASADVTSVTLSRNTAVIVGTGSIQLSADVRPWGIDDGIIWTSDNEEVAVVNDEGMVTGVTEGTAVITAASALDPEIYDECEVTVKFVDKDLNAVIWDENGAVWFSTFNLKSLPAYEKLNDERLRLELASLAYDENMTLYGATYDSSNTVSSLYTVDPETWTATEIGGTDIAYMDICQAPSMGEGNLMFGIYGTYVVLIDKTTGDYTGAFNLSSSTGGNALVGITYFQQVFNTYYSLNTDWILLVDVDGNLYRTGYISMNGSNYTFGVTKLGNLGAASDTDHFQSLYYDGEDVFWSCFNQGTNKVDVIMVDDLLQEIDGSTYFVLGDNVYNAGSFADGVWPVGGLFELGNNPTYVPSEPETSLSGAVIDDSVEFVTRIKPIEMALPIPDAELDDPVPVEEPETAGSIEVIDEIEGGSLNFVKPTIPGENETQGVNSEITVEITADELTKNGKLEISYDPATAILNSYSIYPTFRALVDETEEDGHLVLAWVDLDGIPAGEPVLVLKFDKSSFGSVTITTLEVNEKDADTEEAELPRVEEVVLGNGTTPAGAPVILTHPENVTAEAGTIATFTVVAKGIDMRYQWQWSKDGGTSWSNSSVATAGYNTDTLQVNVAAYRNGYQYRCVVSNSVGSVTSDPAKLTIAVGAPDITSHPSDVSAEEGTVAVFKVVATGTGLSYQWQWSKDHGTVWNNSSSATVGYNTATLKVNATTARNGYMYRCIVTNDGGTVVSEAATLTVTGASPKITGQPESVTATVGSTATFTVSAKGADLSYQWQWSKDGGKTWSNSSSATTGYNTPSLTVNAALSRNGYQYRCQVSNPNGTATSEVAILTVNR